MSILIKGIDMPKNGRVTIELASEETGTNILARITDDKTGKLIEHKGAVVIHTPHGRLIDADELIKQYSFSGEEALEMMAENMEAFRVTYELAKWIRNQINQASTIIEAEE